MRLVDIFWTPIYGELVPQTHTWMIILFGSSLYKLLYEPLDLYQ